MSRHEYNMDLKDEEIDELKEQLKSLQKQTAEAKEIIKSFEMETEDPKASMYLLKYH